jgi:hypothetical protein
MEWQKPASATLWRAIGTYLRLAYEGDAAGAGGFPSGTPSAVRAKLQVLRATDERDLFDSNVFERDPGPAGHAHAASVQNGGRPRRYCLRLGNRNYPHMKMVVDRAPDGRGYLLRADTHDNHVRPKPGSRDEKPFLELMEKNRVVADAIESAWEQEGLPTFKRFLREDLERRKAAMAANPPPAPQ